MGERAVVEVAPGVFVMTSAKYATTSTIVRRGDSALLVDPAWTVDELDGIADWLSGNGCTVAAGFSTHAHHDHLLWHPRFGEAPRWASPASVRCIGEWYDELTSMLDPRPDDWPNPIDGVCPIEPGDAPHVLGAELVVHDGHAPGHTALLFADRGVLVAGDMLSDIELPLPFNPDDLPGYLDALDALAGVVATADVLVPGHGSPTAHPMERLDADRRYLDALLHGHDPDDARRGLAGMDDAHAKNVLLAQRLRAG
jgi:glyoxylase-like metal-dependent hydrolase (beta-lactamase superfamily II)